jgi:chemotaxis protein CheD
VSGSMLAVRPSIRTPIGAIAHPPLPSLPATYVHPGQIVVSEAPGVLTTILGSCVAVCLNDPKLRIGGLNHYLLPIDSPSDELAGRYAPSAIEQLIAEMRAQGAAMNRMVAHIVGGAAVLAAFGREGQQHLGMRNVAIAREYMSRYRIPVASLDVGGTRGRKLMFAPRDGATCVHLIGQR